jgi:hypothetical protein
MLIEFIKSLFSSHTDDNSNIGVETSRPVRIMVSSDFSRVPGGRSDGDRSGYVFRTTLINPLLNEGKNIEIILDGTYGYASSFLDEVFGGIAKEYGKEVAKNIKIVSEEDPSLITEINMYIDNSY